MLKALNSDEEFAQELDDHGSTYSVVLFQKGGLAKDLPEMVLERLALRHKDLAFFKMNVKNDLECCKDVTVFPSVLIYRNSLCVKSVLCKPIGEVIQLVAKLSGVVKCELDNKQAQSMDTTQSSSEKLHAGDGGKSSGIQYGSQSSGDVIGGGFGAVGTSPTVSDLRKVGYRQSSSSSINQSGSFESPLRGGGGSSVRSIGSSPADMTLKVKMEKDDSSANRSAGGAEHGGNEGAGQSPTTEKGLDGRSFRLLTERIRELEERVAILEDLKKAQAAEINHQKELVGNAKKEVEVERSKVTTEMTAMKKQVSYHKDAAAKELKMALKFKEELHTVNLHLEHTELKLANKERECEALSKKVASLESDVEGLHTVNDTLSDMLAMKLEQDEAVKVDTGGDGAEQSKPAMTSTPNAKSVNIGANGGVKNNDDMLPTPSKRKCMKSIGGEMLTFDDALGELLVGVEESPEQATSDKKIKKENVADTGLKGAGKELMDKDKGTGGIQGHNGGDGESMDKDKGMGTIQGHGEPIRPVPVYQIPALPVGLERIEKLGNGIDEQKKGSMEGVGGGANELDETDDEDMGEVDSDASFTDVMAKFEEKLRKNK